MNERDVNEHDVDFSEWTITEGADFDLPNPLIVREGVLPANAREHLLASDDGRVVIQYPPEDQRGLEALEPVFDVVRSLSAATYRLDDFSMLSQIPHLEALEVRGKVRITPVRQVWSELRSFDGEWQRGVEDFVSAPRMKSLLLIRATQRALDLIQGPLDYIGLRRPNLPAGSAGWPYPARDVHIDTATAIDVGSFRHLTDAETVSFEAIGEVCGLDKVSAHKPFRELALENVRSLGEGTDVWKIRAHRIYVEGKPNVMKWVAEAWPTRPDNWADTWVFGDAFRF